jgi:hypothetical protein
MFRMAYEKPLMREATGMAAEACDIEGLYRALQGARSRFS